MENLMLVLQSVALFIVAGLFEIGGGYLVWQWWRNGGHWSIGLLGAAILFLYDIVPAYQPVHFYTLRRAMGLQHNGRTTERKSSGGRDWG
jgi:small multidrug resistance family-3 protein